VQAIAAQTNLYALRAFILFTKWAHRADMGGSVQPDGGNVVFVRTKSFFIQEMSFDQRPVRVVPQIFV
jgi:hypothetical protein